MTNTKIAGNAVTGGKIAPGSVGTADLAAMPHARAIKLTTTQTFANVTLTQVELDTLEVSGGGMTLEDNELRFSRSGVYFVHGTIAWAANSTGGRQLVLMEVDAPRGASDDVAASSINTVQSVSLLGRFTADAKIQLYARQTSGGNLSTVAHGISATSLSAFWVGP